jgi:hypothetical protein
LFRGFGAPLCGIWQMASINGVKKVGRSFKRVLRQIISVLPDDVVLWPPV